jgi:hypothetical protein
MIIQLETTGTVIALEKILIDFSKKNSVKSIIILAGNNSEFIPEKLNPLLRSISVPIIGGVFPAIMHNEIFHEVGTVVIGLSKLIENYVIRDMSNEDMDLDSIVEEIGINKTTIGNETFFVFIDGFSSQQGQLVDSLFAIFGVVNSFIGGGAGYYHPSVGIKSKPCVLTNEGIFNDSAVIGILQQRSEICVAHGFNKISKSYRVTNTRKNKIVTIDWKPALETYMQILKEDSGLEVTKDIFFEISKSYSIGIERIGGNTVVRQVIAFDTDGSITFTVPIPNESFICVLKGDEKSMLEAVKSSTCIFYNDLNRLHTQFLFLVYCVGRYYFMGEGVQQEISWINQQKMPMVGVLSLSEIANTGTNFIESYNKTFVIGVINAQ